MTNKMGKTKTFLKNLWNDENGQGTAEYVLLLVIVVAVVIVFKDKIKKAIGDKMNDLESGIQQVQ